MLLRRRRCHIHIILREIKLQSANKLRWRLICKISVTHPNLRQQQQRQQHHKHIHMENLNLKHLISFKLWR